MKALESYDREDLVYLAFLAEESAMYEDMAEFVRAFVGKSHSDLTEDERNVLSVGFKHFISEKRSSWRVASAAEQREEKAGNYLNLQEAGRFRRKVERELEGACNEVLKVIENQLLPLASEPESQAFYFKMKGDYFRYLAEVTVEATQEECVSKAQSSYKEALEIAKGELPLTHPLRLGIALNYSVFLFDIQQDSEHACSLTKAVFDEVLSELRELPSESAQKTLVIVQQMRENLVMWAK